MRHHVPGWRWGAAILFAASLVASGSARGQGCSGDPEFGTLDFWVGEWDVRVGNEPVGENRIEKILDGCAILEHWKDVTGGEGKSLFYYNPTIMEWRQVWVTETPDRPGGVKEKVLVERLEDGAIRFQGDIPVPGGGSYLDRTTLTPLPDGTVRQVIERSTDDGTTWETGFDAVYHRRDREPGE